MFESYFSNERGVAAVEFALVAPMLLLLLMGIYDYGMFMNQRMMLESTARAAAEYINQGGSEDDLQADIVDMMNLGANGAALASLQLDTDFICECTGGAVLDCDDEDASCTADDEDTDTYIRRYVEVSVSMTFDTLFPYPGLPQSVPMSGNVRMQIE